MKTAPASLSPSPLDARLVLYTTAGAGLLLAPGAAEAQTIVYSGLQNISRASGSFYQLDLNGDSAIDFNLTSSNVPSDGSNFVNVLPFGGSRVVKTGSFATPLSAGVTLNAITSGFAGSSGYLRKEPGALLGPGTWPQGTERYLGLKFLIGGATHYGWARVSPTVNDTNSSFILHDWAYNSEAQGAIVTGQTSDTSSAVPEPSSLALFAAGTGAALGLLRRRRSTV